MSEDWQTFDGVIEPMEWDKNTYTVLRIPDAVMATLPAGTRRVEGEFGDFPINLALTKSPAIDGTFVYTGKSFLAESGLEVGVPFEARIRFVDPDLVEMPEGVAAALRAAGRIADWNKLTPGDQRGRLHTVNTAKRADTRARRITTLISKL